MIKTMIKAPVYVKRFLSYNQNISYSWLLSKCNLKFTDQAGTRF